MLVISTVDQPPAYPPVCPGLYWRLLLSTVSRSLLRNGIAPIVKNIALRDAVAGRGGQVGAGAKPRQLEMDFWQSVGCSPEQSLLLFFFRFFF